MFPTGDANKSLVEDALAELTRKQGKQLKRFVPLKPRQSAKTAEQEQKPKRRWSLIPQKKDPNANLLEIALKERARSTSPRRARTPSPARERPAARTQAPAKTPPAGQDTGR